MAAIILYVFAVVVLLFGFVVVFGAPYLPTLKTQTDTALDMLDLKPGQKLLELGCGDGRVVKAAAKRGLNCVGYELNPILVMIARIHTWRYRKNVEIIWGNFWHKDFSGADAIFVFLLDKYMKKLDKKITQENSNSVKVVSFAFKIPGRKPTKTKKGIYLYNY